MRIASRLGSVAYLAGVLPAVFGYVPSASAYRTVADDLGASPLLAVWTGTEVEIASYGEPPDGIDAVDWAGALERAAAAWDVPCSRFRFGALPASGPRPSDSDGLTTVSAIFENWEERGYGANQAAVTELRFVETASGLEIVDADIFLNADTFDWAAPGAPELLAVLVHELGHVAGLAHPCAHEPTMDEPLCAERADIAAESIMHPDYQLGALEPRADDIDGMCALYPRDPCDAISCASGETCEGGVCVPPAICDLDGACPSGVCAVGGPLFGRCVLGATEGAPCARGDECASRLCLSVASGESYCTGECRLDSDCGAGDRCVEVESRQVCAPASTTSSCAVQPTGQTSSAPWAWWLLAAAMMALRRNRRRRADDGGVR